MGVQNTILGGKVFGFIISFNKKIFLSTKRIWGNPLGCFPVDTNVVRYEYFIPFLRNKPSMSAQHSSKVKDAQIQRKTCKGHVSSQWRTQKLFMGGFHSAA